MTEEDFKTTVLYQSLFKVLGNDLDFLEIIQNCLIALGESAKIRYGRSVGEACAQRDVNNAFVWARTPQGHRYWEHIQNRYANYVS